MQDIEPSSIIKALGDNNRLKIVMLLGNGSMYAYQILDQMDISQPTLSHHLSVLENASVVKSVKAGQKSQYTVNRESLAITADFLRSIYLYNNH